MDSIAKLDAVVGILSWHENSKVPISPKGFQNFFLFWVAGTILEDLDVELESAHSSMFQFCL